jgi:hypothetical protein
MAENKMEQVDFWIRYFKEHINTIGCVELDGLDCREVLALLQELADKKVDKPNKMGVVAALFGKKLGEKFDVKYRDVKVKTCKFEERGLFYYDRIDNEWRKNYAYLDYLIRGKAVIVND